MQNAKIIRYASAAFAVFSLAAPASAAVEYSYEDDGKTYVANVTSADTAISDEAITVLDANEITNFAVRGSAMFHVNKGSVYAGDVRATTDLRLSAENSLGVGPGKIYVKEHFTYIRQLKPQKVHFTIENIDPNQHSSFHPLGERPKYYIAQCFQG